MRHWNAEGFRDNRVGNGIALYRRLVLQPFLIICRLRLLERTFNRFPHFLFPLFFVLHKKYPNKFWSKFISWVSRQKIGEEPYLLLKQNKSFTWGRHLIHIIIKIKKIHFKCHWNKMLTFQNHKTYRFDPRMPKVKIE